VIGRREEWLLPQWQEARSMATHGSSRSHALARVLALGAVTALILGSVAPSVAAASPKSRGHASKAAITKVATTHLGRASKPTGSPTGTTPQPGPPGGGGVHAE